MIVFTDHNTNQNRFPSETNQICNYVIDMWDLLNASITENNVERGPVISSDMSVIVNTVTQ